MVRQAGMGENMATKTEINTISEFKIKSSRVLEDLLGFLSNILISDL